jgi:hypothetical protein
MAPATSILMGLGAAALLGVSGTEVESSDNGVAVTCNEDNTLTVDITYDMTAEILELHYGSCDASGVRGTDQNSEFDWTLTFDVTACGMDSKLRTLDYNQTATIRVGRISGGTELTLANFDVDSFCSYTATYTVNFDYGTLTTEGHSFDSTGGLIDLDIKIKSYESSFDNEMSSATQGGEMIYLGMTVQNEGFNHGSFGGSTGKVFAPQSCSVSDKANELHYTLFDTRDSTGEDSSDSSDDTEGSCNNPDVQLTMTYDSASHMWRISHILFLLGNHRTSTFELSCDVVVCDQGGDHSACDDVYDACE